ncbi:MAG: molybdenum cofactor cytidylyltransferase [Gemmatimonadetes bacterium]|nr:molybdenum cofactor cytidylyltransferase [Gemmatimonadota bacterium]
MIAALLLAAGRARRFGADKLTATLGARAVLRWSAEALDGIADETFVVVPPGALMVRAALAGLPVQFVEHPERDAGMGSSIRAGVLALPMNTEAVLIALGDQPLVSRTVVGALRDRWHATRAAAVVPRYLDGRGHPVLFDRACFSDLASLDADHGARHVLDALGGAVAVVEVDERMPLDVDTPEALLAVERLLAG